MLSKGITTGEVKVNEKYMTYTILEMEPGSFLEIIHDILKKKTGNEKLDISEVHVNILLLLLKTCFISQKKIQE